ncbi:MAG: hypothetical protein ACI8RE_002655, partial [Ilumatobacter sp.]
MRVQKEHHLTIHAAIHRVGAPVVSIDSCDPPLAILSPQPST